MVDFFNEDNWTSPRTLAMLGAGAGFLDPRGGMAAGMQGAMQGVRTGQQLQQERLLAQQQAEKLNHDYETKRQFADIMAKYRGQKPDLAAARTELLATGNPDLFGYAESLGKALPKVKTTTKIEKEGKEYTVPIFDTGEFGQAGEYANAVKPMQVNQGSQISFIDPYSLQSRGQVGVGMSPGEGARLNQAAQQFGQTHALDMAKAQQAIAQSKQPQFKDGYWVTPPNANNPQGSVIPTDLATVPKGSEAERAKSAAKVQNILGSDTEQLIGQATGSLAGAGRDWLASTVGVTTDPAKANAALKLRAASLAGNMPRFEGPQSDADRQYYQEMAGDLANPAKTTVEKLTALQELRRIHGLADSSGTIKQPVVPGGKVGGSAGTSGSWGGGNDGWGELK